MSKPTEEKSLVTTPTDASAGSEEKLPTPTLSKEFEAIQVEKERLGAALKTRNRKLLMHGGVATILTLSTVLGLVLHSGIYAASLLWAGVPASLFAIQVSALFALERDPIWMACRYTAIAASALIQAQLLMHKLSQKLKNLNTLLADLNQALYTDRIWLGDIKDASLQKDSELSTEIGEKLRTLEVEGQRLLCLLAQRALEMRRGAIIWQIAPSEDLSDSPFIRLRRLRSALREARHFVDDLELELAKKLTDSQ